MYTHASVLTEATVCVCKKPKYSLDKCSHSCIQNVYAVYTYIRTMSYSTHNNAMYVHKYYVCVYVCTVHVMHKWCSR